MPGKIGEPCLVSKDCKNKNCIDGKCTRKNAKKAVKSKTKSKPKSKPKSETKSVKWIHAKDKFGDEYWYRYVDKKYNETYEDPHKKRVSSVKPKTIKKAKLRRKIGESCEKTEDCINKNCVNGKCTRKNAKTVALAAPVIPGVSEVPFNPTELIKINTALDSLGIKENSFYYDACYFLKNFNKVLNSGTIEQQYKTKPHLLLPFIYPKDLNYTKTKYAGTGLGSLDITEYNKQMRSAYIANRHLKLCLSASDGCSLDKGSYGVV